MLILGYYYYILQYTNFLVIRFKLFSLASSCVLISHKDVFFFSFFFKYSYFFTKTVLIDILSYETPAFNINQNISNYNIILVYLFRNYMLKYICVFTPLLFCSHPHSIDLLFKNAKWLEREVSEMYNIFFLQKSDRRSLFTIPLFYTAPLRKKYPTVGFYEIFLCPLLKKLKFKFLSLQI